MDTKNIKLGASVFSGVLAVVIGFAAVLSSSKPGFVHVAQPKISYIITEQSGASLETPLDGKTEDTQVIIKKKPVKPVIKDTTHVDPKEDCKKSKDPLCGISDGKDIF